MKVGRWWLALATASALGVGTLGGAAVALADAGAQQQVRIELTGPPPHFEPANVTVAPGTRVTWVVTAGSHSSTSVDGLWDSGVGGVGTTVSYTFSQPGTFEYFCTPHRDAGMMGTITVAGAQAGAAPAALPRTGEADTLAAGGMATAAGVLLLGLGWRLRRVRQES